MIAEPAPPARPILVFDFDSTLVSVEGLDELFARSLAEGPDRGRRIREFTEVTDQGMAGAISAEESLRRRLGILDVHRTLVDDVARAISESLSPSVARHLEFFRSNSGRIWVVSGGFEELIGPTLERLGIPGSRLRAHRFRFDPGGRVAGLDLDTPMARGGKTGAVQTLGAARDPIWIVGDGATDLEIRERGFAERFVAYTENRHRDPVVAKADFVARSMDDLLRLLEAHPANG